VCVHTLFNQVVIVNLTNGIGASIISHLQINVVVPIDEMIKKKKSNRSI
jgi:hypothetical protein